MRFLAALGMTLVLTGAATAQDFPTRPIRLVVSFTPGGGADFTARTVGQKMSELLGQPVVVENKPGANGLVGCEAVANSAPDGYTVLETDRGALAVNPSLYKRLPYGPLRAFEYGGIVTRAPYVLVIDSRLPAKTLAEYVKLAKAKPGSLNYGSYGIASMAQLNVEALKAKMGIDLVHVPYKGAGPAVQAVVAGRAAGALGSPPGPLGLIPRGRRPGAPPRAGRGAPPPPQAPPRRRDRR